MKDMPETIPQVGDDEQILTQLLEHYIQLDTPVAFEDAAVAASITEGEGVLWIEELDSELTSARKICTIALRYAIQFITSQRWC
jgi:hypothetical protein